MEDDDLDRYRDLLLLLAFLVGLGGGVLGMANSKPTLGSEFAVGRGLTKEPVLVPAFGSGAPEDSITTIDSTSESVGAIKLGVDNAGASVGATGTMDGGGTMD